MTNKTADKTTELSENYCDKWKNIRKAAIKDVSRISEIYVFNNRQTYYPIFQNTFFSFEELQVLSYAEIFKRNELSKAFVYDDGIVKGFMVVNDHEIEKLYVDSFFVKKGIGSALLKYAVLCCSANYLWVLKKNKSAIEFYKRSGFIQTSTEKLLEGINHHTEPVVKMIIRNEEKSGDI